MIEALDPKYEGLKDPQRNEAQEARGTLPIHDTFFGGVSGKGLPFSRIGTGLSRVSMTL